MIGLVTVALWFKGRSGIVDTMMGSVAQRVSNTAKQAVLLVK
jgi:nucleotide-binding universal stress UspA family protein